MILCSNLGRLVLFLTTERSKTGSLSGATGWVTVSSGAEMSVDKSKSFTVLGAGLLVEGRGGARGVPPLQGEGAAPISKGALGDGGALVVRGTFSLGDFEILGGGGGQEEGGCLRRVRL